MPVIIKEFSWHQTSTSVFIVIPLRKVPPSCINCLFAENYCKITYRAFIFEAFFPHSIAFERTRCIYSENQAVFEFAKNDPGNTWNRLCLGDELSKDEKRIIRQNAIDSNIAYHKRYFSYICNFIYFFELILFHLPFPKLIKSRRKSD